MKEAFDYYQGQAAKYWTSFGIYNQGMIALQAKRYDNQQLGTGIMKSIKERSLTNEELGMYWKDNVSGYYWYQAPIETQALLIEAFDEVVDDQTAVEEMKVWLLKQKQTTDWKTTKATRYEDHQLLSDLFLLPGKLRSIRPVFLSALHTNSNRSFLSSTSPFLGY